MKSSGRKPGPLLPDRRTPEVCLFRYEINIALGFLGEIRPSAGKLTPPRIIPAASRANDSIAQVVRAAALSGAGVQVKFSG